MPKERLDELLYYLGQEFKELPPYLEFEGWSFRIERLMEKIEKKDKKAFERLEPLVNQARLSAQIHVGDVDFDEAPSVVEQDATRYFQNVSFLTSEINSLKS